MPRDLSGMVKKPKKTEIEPSKDKKPSSVETTRPKPKVIKPPPKESEKKVIEGLTKPLSEKKKPKIRGWPKGKPRKEAGAPVGTLAPKAVETIKSFLKLGHQTLLSVILTKFIYHRPTKITDNHAQSLTDALWQILDPWLKENVEKVGPYTIPLVVYFGLVGVTFTGQGVEEVPLPPPSKKDEKAA